MKHVILKLSVLVSGLTLLAGAAHADCSDSGINPCDSNDVYGCCVNEAAMGIDPMGDQVCIYYASGMLDLLCAASGGTVSGGGGGTPPSANCPQVCVAACEQAIADAKNNIYNAPGGFNSCMTNANIALQACGNTPTCVASFVAAETTCTDTLAGRLQSVDGYINAEQNCSTASCDPTCSYISEQE